jgi:asparagine synthase (glutamine-hydrolysing)
MCGVTGFFPYAGSSVTADDARDTVKKMNATISHRGPDADGFFFDSHARCFFGHRRLSIIDLSPAGAQPMRSATGRWALTYNGELYNYQDFIPLLAREGVQLRGHSDTEVLVNLIELYGTEILPKLDGMFAFAAFDTHSGDMILARDAFGEKPLYLAESNGGLAFASELRALEVLPGFSRTVNLDAMAEVLMFQYIGSPRSIYPHVQKLSPGTWLRVDGSGKQTTGRHFNFDPGAKGFSTRPAGELVDELEELLTASLRRRLIADVPLGAFLSGGVDSSLTAALAVRKLGVDLKTYSMGFAGSAESEHETARAFARHLGTQHHEEIVTPDVAKFLDNVGGYLDEPNADSSCLPTYLLSRFARQHVTVAVSGDGGDELFGGYGRYFSTLRDSGSIRGLFAPNGPGRNYYSNRILVMEENAVRELMGEIPDGLAKHLDRLRREIDAAQEPMLCRLRKSDVENYMPGAVLPKVDRMSMQHSLEVRTPFLNRDLARFAESLPPDLLVKGGVGKWLLRQVAYRYLPKSLIDMPKKGFGLPLSDWGRGAILSQLRTTIGSADSPLRRSFGAGRVDKFLKNQENTFSAYQAWGVAMLEMWCREHRAEIEPLRSSGVAFSAAAPTNSSGSYRCLAVGASFWAIASEDMSAEFTMEALFRLVAAYPQLIERIDGFELPPKWLPQLPEKLVADSVLYVLDERLVDNLSANALRKWHKLGVTAVVFAHPFDQNAIFRLTLRDADGLPPAKAASRKRWSRRFGLKGRRWALQHATGEEERSSEYAVWTRTGQVPPIPTSHEAIRQGTGAGYSIWDGQLLVGDKHGAVGLLPTAIALSPFSVPQVQDYLEFIPDHSTCNPSVFFAGRAHEAIQQVCAQSAFGLELKEQYGRSRRGPIVMFTHAVEGGGAEKQWCYLAIGLKKLGIPVVVVTTRATQSGYLHMLKDANVQSIVAEADERYPLDAATVKKLFELFAVGFPWMSETIRVTYALSKLQPLALVAQLDGPNVVGAVAAALAGVPKVVLSFRNVNPSHFSYLRNDWFLPCYQALAANPNVQLTGNSRFGNDDYADWIGISRTRIEFLPNVVEIPRDTTVNHAGLSAARGETIDVLGVFRLSEEKEPFHFVEVIRRLVMERPTLRACIAGEGRLESAVAAMIEEYSLTNNLELLGVRGDVAKLMGNAKVLLHTAKFEGTPNVILEAQAVGLPVVCTDAGASRECLYDGLSGHVCAVGDLTGLCRKTKQLLDDEALRQAFSAEARSFIGEGRSSRVVAERLLSIVNVSTLK